MRSSRMLRDDAGTVPAEYSVLAALIGAAVVTTVGGIGSAVADLFVQLVNRL